MNVYNVEALRDLHKQIAETLADHAERHDLTAKELQSYLEACGRGMSTCSAFMLRGEALASAIRCDLEVI